MLLMPKRFDDEGLNSAVNYVLFIGFWLHSCPVAIAFPKLFHFYSIQESYMKWNFSTLFLINVGDILYMIITTAYHIKNISTLY